ncbi:tetratricopeptide repeat protein [Hellea balneolensis]|uniref:tetratricopeptide repeat protein n=1 Tax=Hellea balneolensis TaxID=287478 RepID=UPI00040075A0|nr:tetratricopeptide repeat protein [Hellea balneolensis]
MSGAFTAGLGQSAYADSTTSTQPSVSFDDALSAFNSGDKLTALSHARVAARAGSADAAVMAGYILRKGETGSINLTEAKSWYLQAANKNHPDALVALGEMAIKNEAGLTQADAVAYLTRASDMGRTDAMRALSDLYRTGQGTAPSTKKSQNLLKKASQSFDSDATKRLGDSYFEKDPKKALKYYEQAAESGHIEAAYIAGVMYAENFEIRPNSAKSAALLKQAAEGGHAAAQADYGLLVYQGYGAARSETEAAKWFEKSAKGGDKEGQFLYAFTLAKGEGVTQSFEDAYYWLLKSDKSGNDDYDKDRAELKKRLEANVDATVLDRARARVK